MTQISIKYTESGSIESWRYVVDDDYSGEDGELVVDDREVDHRDLKEKMVDTSADSPTLVDDPNYEPTPTPDELVTEGPVRRAKVSDTTRSNMASAYSNLKTARSNDNLQGQIDALETIVDELTNVVTGDTLSEISSD